MAIIQGNAKQGSVRGFYPKVINGSLRFNSADTAHLQWKPESDGNRKTWTFSFWTKLADWTPNEYILGAGTDSSNQFFLTITTDARLAMRQEISNTTYTIFTAEQFRDPSAWYHIVAVFDSTQATQSERMLLYINGQRYTHHTGNYVPQNYDGLINSSTYNHYLGALRDDFLGGFDGYLANVHFIDGQALTASDFGETKNGVWVAKDYAGTFGTNGFYLTFEDDTQVEAFNTVLYRGNGGKQSITGTGFKPDLVWIKKRNSTSNNTLTDAVRGVNRLVFANVQNVEADFSGGLSSFDSDGFSLAGGDTGFNASGDTYVAWTWKAGDSNVSNTDGTITSTVRANDTYGFSIVSYTGTGANATVGHGLSSAPDLIIVKNRNLTDSWLVKHSSFSDNNKALFLNETSATGSSSTYWNNTAPTTSVFSVGSDGKANGSGQGIIAYCWAEKAGYSKFGSYTGNGSTTGPTVTTGFNPACLIVKRTDTTGNWFIWDNTRDTDGVFNTNIHPNSSVAEAASGSNFVTPSGTGFQLTGTGAETNASGGTYIYAAFADTREAAFWLDQSGNDNDWQPVNLDHNDTVADSPTNNFATMNPLAPSQGSGWTFKDGNLVVENITDATGNPTMVEATMEIPSSGKFYMECSPLSLGAGSAGIHSSLYMGIAKKSAIEHGTSSLGNYADDYALLLYNGYKRNSGTSTAYGSAVALDDTIMMAVDMDAGKIWWGKNGTWFNSGNPSAGTNEAFSGLSGTYKIMLQGWRQTNYDIPWQVNFGQQPFKYDPPA